MKIKSLLFAALVAFTASAQHVGNGDLLTSPAVTINAGETAQLVLSLTRQNSADFTNLQFNLTFPEGIRPALDSDMECYGWEGDGIPLKAKKPVMTYTDNMDVASKYPEHSVVGVNMSKTAITANPCEVYVLSVGADADAKSGEVELKANTLKYTSYNDEAWHSLDPQVVCKITINGASGINDLQVNNAKTYKTVENGQVIIVKGDVRYNTMGQIVK